MKKSLSVTTISKDGTNVEYGLTHEGGSEAYEFYLNVSTDDKGVVRGEYVSTRVRGTVSDSGCHELDLDYYNPVKLEIGSVSCSLGCILADVFIETNAFGTTVFQEVDCACT